MQKHDNRPEHKECLECGTTYWRPFHCGWMGWVRSQFCSISCSRLWHAPRRITIPLADRFWAKVKKGDGCWEWVAFRNRGGYGVVGVEGGKAGRAHRIAWELKHGPIPTGLCVLHHCDNPPCVRTDPDEKYPNGHLFLGTLADNNADKAAKDRAYHMAGVKHWKARLCDYCVMFIRESPLRGVDLARLYGMRSSSINHIRTRRLWRHVVDLREHQSAPSPPPAAAPNAE